jgi:hypothetical protein
MLDGVRQQKTIVVVRELRGDGARRQPLWMPIRTRMKILLPCFHPTKNLNRQVHCPTEQHQKQTRMVCARLGVSHLLFKITNANLKSARVAQNAQIQRRMGCLRMSLQQHHQRYLLLLLNLQPEP